MRLSSSVQPQAPRPLRLPAPGAAGLALVLCNWLAEGHRQRQEREKYLPPQHGARRRAAPLPAEGAEHRTPDWMQFLPAWPRWHRQSGSIPSTRVSNSATLPPRLEPAWPLGAEPQPRGRHGQAAPPQCQSATTRRPVRLLSSLLMAIDRYIYELVAQPARSSQTKDKSGRDQIAPKRRGQRAGGRSLFEEVRPPYHFHGPPEKATPHERTGNHRGETFRVAGALYGPLLVFQERRVPSQFGSRSPARKATEHQIIPILERPPSTARHRVVLGRDNSGRMNRSKKASAPVPGPLSRARVDVASIPGNPSFDKHPPFEDRDEWLPHTHRLLLSFAQGALGRSLGSYGSAHPWDAHARLWSAPRARPQGDSL